MSRWPWLRRGLSVLLVTAAFAFLAVTIAADLDSLRSFRWDLRPGLLVLSLLGLIAVLLLGVGYWAVLLRSFGVDVPLLPLARAWFLSNLSRYIPGIGAVWQFVSLAQFGTAAGLTPLVSITSLLVQMGFMLLSAAVMGVLILPLSPLADAYPFVAGMRWLTPLALVAVHPAIVKRLVGAMARLSKRKVVEWQASWMRSLLLLLLALGLWAVYGATFFLFLNSFVPLSASLLPTVVAMHAVAFLVGYLAIFAPAGLGFKDATLTVLLQGLGVPAAVAASLAVLARLWTIAGEVIPALVLLFRRVRPGDPAAPDAGLPEPRDGAGAAPP